MRMMRKTFGVIAVACLVIFVSFPPAEAANRDFAKINTVKMGVLAPVQMPVGQSIINSAKLAAEEINAAGGIHGKKVELVVGDTESKPEKGVTAMKKLVLEDKVDVLVGEYSSGVALAIQPFLSGYKIVLLTTGTASPDLTNNVKKDYAKNKYFFRDMVNSDRQQKLAFYFLRDFINKKFGYKKFAILPENAKWTEDYAPNLKKDLESAGFEVPFYERFDTDIKDFSPIFTKIKNLEIQFITQIVSHAASIPLVKAWADNKPAPMGGTNVTSQDAKFWEMTNGACLGESTFNQIARGPMTDKTIPYWDTYVKKFGTSPLYAGAFTYDGVHMLAEVIKSKKSVKSDDIVAGLETIVHKGIMHNEIAFEKQSHDLIEGRYSQPQVQWQAGGKQVIVYPEAFKTGEYIKPPWWNK
jgi:branched-chain amino acid transport system substrate-binding protein